MSRKDIAQRVPREQAASQTLECGDLSPLCSAAKPPSFVRIRKTHAGRSPLAMQLRGECGAARHGGHGSDHREPRRTNRSSPIVRMTHRTRQSTAPRFARVHPGATRREPTQSRKIPASGCPVPGSGARSHPGGNRVSSSASGIWTGYSDPLRARTAGGIVGHGTRARQVDRGGHFDETGNRGTRRGDQFLGRRSAGG